MKFIIFNWKSYLNFKESISLVKFLAKMKYDKSFKFIVAPSNISLGHLNKTFKNLLFSAQNFDLYGKGGFTSYTSINDIKDQNIKFAILGHSEVRQYSGENDSIVSQKLKISLSSKITPII